MNTMEVYDMKRRQLASIFLALALGVGSSVLTGCAGKSTYYTHSVTGLDRNGDPARDYSPKYQKVGEIPDDGGFEPLSGFNDVVSIVTLALPDEWNNNEMTYDTIYAISYTDVETFNNEKAEISGKKDSFNNAVSEVNTLISQQRAAKADLPLDEAEEKLKDLTERFDKLLNAQPTSRSSFKLLRADRDDESEIVMAAEIPVYDTDGNMIYDPIVKLQYNGGAETNSVHIKAGTNELRYEGEQLISDTTEGFPEEATLSDAFDKLMKELAQVKDSVSGNAKTEASSENSSDESTDESTEESAEEPVDESSEESEEESAEASVEESSEETVESSEETADGEALAVVKFQKPDTWEEDGLSVIVFEGDIRTTVNMTSEGDGVYSASIPKTNAAGEEFTNPKFKFHSKSVVGTIVESDEIALNGDKTYSLTLDGRAWRVSEA